MKANLDTLATRAEELGHPCMPGKAFIKRTQSYGGANTFSTTLKTKQPPKDVHVLRDMQFLVQPMLMHYDEYSVCFMGGTASETHAIFRREANSNIRFLDPNSGTAETLAPLTQAQYARLREYALNAGKRIVWEMEKLAKVKPKVMMAR